MRGIRIYWGVINLSNGLRAHAILKLNTTNRELPSVKCRYLFERMELEGDIVAVPVGENAAEFHAVLNLNEEAMRILELLQEETTEQNVVRELLAEYSATEEEIYPMVHSFIEQLREEGLLIEQY